MADPVQDKVKKLFESRAKAELDLKKCQRDVVDAVPTLNDAPALNG
jgi:hypothetical protein